MCLNCLYDLYTTSSFLGNGELMFVNTFNHKIYNVRNQSEYNLINPLLHVTRLFPLFNKIRLFHIRHGYSSLIFNIEKLYEFFTVEEFMDSLYAQYFETIEYVDEYMSDYLITHQV